MRREQKKAGMQPAPSFFQVKVHEHLHKLNTKGHKKRAKILKLQQQNKLLHGSGVVMQSWQSFPNLKVWPALCKTAICCSKQEFIVTHADLTVWPWNLTVHAQFSTCLFCRYVHVYTSKWACAHTCTCKRGLVNLICTCFPLTFSWSKQLMLSLHFFPCFLFANVKHNLCTQWHMLRCYVTDIQDGQH